MKTTTTGIPRLIDAARFSAQGIKFAYGSEEAFRLEVLLAIVLVPLSFFVADTAVEWALLIATTVLLLIVELINSAVETVVDRIGSDWNELSGHAKDMGSAAVLLATGLLVVTWIAILVF